jgi:predicted DsbA family dithiol-disulfide isomerase
MIFENQSNWAKNGNNPKDTAMEYARDLGLDMTRFENDYSSDEIRRKVDDAVTTGRNIGISYTPTFFVNGVRIANPNSYAQFIEIINQAEAEANAETTSGTNTSSGQTTTFTSTSSLKTTNN